MMVVGDNLGEKEEKIEEAWASQPLLLHHIIMIIIGILVQMNKHLCLTKHPDHIPHICHGSHGYICGEKICHVEKFQISVHDRRGEI